MSNALPENICGRPVSGGNFFGRTEVAERAWTRLETDHLLLSAPRRVGKTSLMHHLEANARARGWLGGIYVTAQSVRSEEAFVAKLMAAVARAPECMPVADALRRGTYQEVFRKVSSVTAGPLEVALRDAGAPDWTELGAELAEALRALPPGRKLLILVDELPVFLLKLLAQDRQRASDFLDWFRDLRQGPSTRSDDVRWLLAGSIGLGPLARRERWSATINDLLPIDLGAFPEEVAADFLDKLGRRYGLRFTDAGRTAVLAEIGWHIPFYLHLFVSGLRELPPAELGEAEVVRVRELLLGPSSSKHFAPWWERLEDELGPLEAAAARAVLARCAADPGGAPTETLAAALSGFHAEVERDERRRWLLEVLEGDGYLAFDHGRWRFRSPLLRRVWAARMAR